MDLCCGERMRVSRSGDAMPTIGMVNEWLEFCDGEGMLEFVTAPDVNAARMGRYWRSGLVYWCTNVWISVLVKVCLDLWRHLMLILPEWAGIGNLDLCIGERMFGFLCW